MAPAHKFQIELIERRAEIPVSAQQWNDLVAANETRSIFQTFEWFDTWWRVFGIEHELFFLVLRHEGEVIGFAPLMISRGSWGFRELQFIGTGNADYLDFVIVGNRREAIESICEFLRDRARCWDRFRLCNLPAGSSSLFFLTHAVSSRGLRLVEEARIRCPTLLLETDRSNTLALINRYSVRRPLNWFSKRGEVRFRHVSSLQEILSLLPIFFDQHVRRWQAVGKPSLFERGSQKTFYEQLASSMHEAGWLLFSVLELDGKPIAFHFGFDYEGTVIWYKPAFDYRYAEHSPGLLLVRQLIEDGLVRRRQEIDFTIGEEHFKDRFANMQRANVYLGLYHSRLYWAWAVCVRTARRHASRLLRAVRAVAKLLPGSRGVEMRSRAMKA